MGEGPEVDGEGGITWAMSFNRSTGKRQRLLGGCCDAEGVWYDTIQDLKIKPFKLVVPFANISEAREAASYLHGKPGDDGEHVLEIVDLLTGMRFSEKGGKYRADSNRHKKPRGSKWSRGFHHTAPGL